MLFLSTDHGQLAASPPQSEFLKTIDVLGSNTEKVIHYVTTNVHKHKLRKHKKVCLEIQWPR